MEAIPKYKRISDLRAQWRKMIERLKFFRDGLTAALPPKNRVAGSVPARESGPTAVNINHYLGNSVKRLGVNYSVRTNLARFWGI
jgi:hypothetical protein